MIGNPLLLGGGDYEISRSVRLRSSATGNFSRTPASTTNRRTWTWSGWVKRGALGTTQTLFVAGLISGTFNYTRLFFDASDRLVFAHYPDALSGWLTTTQVFRDPSAWYHIVAVFNSPDATASNRMQLYLNGVQITAFTTGAFATTYPAQNTDSFVNNASFVANIGRNVNGGTAETLDGYLTEINFIDGQALTPSSFGESNSTTGVWQPKKYTGTYGTNGFYLNFSDNSNNTAATIGKDYSGNGNNWTPNNISVTSGTTYDSMLDVPTMWADGGNGRGNYCVINPLSKPANVTLSNANLTAAMSTTSGHRSVASTFYVDAGSWFWEITPTTVGSGSAGIGVANTSFTIGSEGGTNTYFYYADGTKAINGTYTSYGASYTSNDVIGVAFDATNGTLTFYKNGTSQGQITGIPTGVTYVPFMCSNTSVSASTFVANFGQRPFTYTPPSVFKALNTQNLPDSTIKKGNQYFDVSTWTGDQTSRTITNSGAFQPDFVWTKSRSDAESHRLHDAVRGGNGSVLYELNSNETSAEGTDTLVSGFASNGFTIASGANSPNVTGRTYVAWQWKEGATQGFDIVTYTGTGAAQNIAHSLGVAPRMIIAKRRNASQNWFVGHSSFASWASAIEGLNTTAAVNNGATLVFNSTAPTSSVFTVGTDLSASGGTYVAYLFAEVAGFSRFGSYTGNGSTDGPMVFTGFQPRWVMIKRTDSTSDWFVFDTSRNTFNTMSSFLRPNWSDAEATNTNHSIDLLSNGFKSRAIDTGVNASGGTYIYAAFASNPFKYSLAR